MRRILVTGGRDVTPTTEEVREFEWVLHELTWGEPCEIVHGGCPTGVDAWADAYGKAKGDTVTVFPASWEEHGRSAGPIRNKAMVLYAIQTGACVVFRGGAGTADCERQARAAGLEVVTIGGAR